jgi:serine/threonine-protein kinase RsbT
MQYGFSTHQGLGVSLPDAQLPLDDFGIESKVGKDTVVTMKKWLPA